MKILRIYTDGACSGNQNEISPGGWGAVLEYGSALKELCGGESSTTNNRMEMTALLSAFESLKRDGLQIEVFSDSSYLMDCFRKKWYLKWQQNGWITSSKTPVENRDLWEKLLSYLSRHTIRFYRVKGHVNINSTSTDFNKLYSKFVEWNGSSFSFEDFIYVTKMNNRADALANEGMKPFK